MALIRRALLDRDRVRPWDQLTRMMDEMSRGYEGATDLGAWNPSCNIYDKNGDLMVEAELPGVAKEDIDVRVENGVLTLRGERKQEEEVKEEDFYRLERAYGSFSRSFNLPSNVDAERIDATFKDGVLKLRVPRIEEAKPKQVNIT